MRGVNNRILSEFVEIMTSLVFSFDYNLLTSRVEIQPFSNFAVINDGQRYLCNSLIASSFSNVIYNIIMENCAADEVEIHVGNGPMKYVIDYLNGKNVSIPKEDETFVLNAAIELGMESLISSINVNLLQISPKEALDFAIRGYQNGVSINCFAAKIASGFEELIKSNAFEGVPEEIIDIILSSKHVEVKPTVLIPFLLKYFNFAKNPNHRLAKHYPFSEIPKNAAAALLQKPSVNINRFISLLPACGACGNSEKVDIRNTIQYSKGHEFEGLMFVLIHPTIISSSLEAGSLDNLIIEEGSFLSSPEDNPYIIFDFGLNCILISSYTLDTTSQLETGVTPASWKLEASSDKENWVLVDERSEDLTFSPGVFNFETTTNSFYKYIKFTQLKSNPESDKRLSLSRIEFFGRLRN